MVTLDEALATNRRAVEDMIATAGRCARCWTDPRAPGKWSPSQITEHVARSFDESAHVIAGRPSKFPALPWPLRVLARRLLFDASVRKGGFPKAKTRKAFDPHAGPRTVDEARARLEESVARFERACRESAGEVEIDTPTFGRVSITDYVRFQEIHVRHHTKQMPVEP